jgi:competence protein ComEC
VTIKHLKLWLSTVFFLTALIACSPVSTSDPNPGPPDNPSGDSTLPSDPPPSGVTPTPSPNGGELVMTFLNVGQGDSVLIQTPDGKSALYDAGRYKNLATQLVQARGVTTLDLAVASHFDADHIAGLTSVARAFKPTAFLNNGIPSSTITSGEVVAAMTEVGAQGLVASERTISLGSSVTLEVLPPAANAPASDQNANSVGLLVKFGTFRAFLGGDSTAGEEASWLAAYKSKLSGIDVYKSAHHGSAYNDTASFLEALNPKEVIVSVGKNSYGHPTASALALYASVGARTWRTDLQGSVTVRVSSGGTVVVQAEQP